jgi:hypothetical protein
MDGNLRRKKTVRQAFLLVSLVSLGWWQGLVLEAAALLNGLDFHSQGR